MEFNDYVQLAVAVGTIGATTVGVTSLVRQARRDAQKHEITLVEWETEWRLGTINEAEGAWLTITNVGSSKVKNLHVAHKLPNESRDLYYQAKLGTMKPREPRTAFFVFIEDLRPQELEDGDLHVFPYQLVLTWSSNLGVPHQTSIWTKPEIW